MLIDSLFIIYNYQKSFDCKLSTSNGSAPGDNANTFESVEKSFPTLSKSLFLDGLPKSVSEASYPIDDASFLRD